MLVASLVGWWQTASRQDVDASSATRSLVDASVLDTAKRLLPLATTAAEQALATRAVEAADHVLDLNFMQALRDAADRPPPSTPEIRTAQARLDEAARQLVEDNVRIAALREALRAAGDTPNAAMEAELAVAEAQYEVHQYQFAAADRALAAAGGNLKARIETLVAEHRAAGMPAVPAPAALAWPDGLVPMAGRWLEIRRKVAVLEAASAQVRSAADALTREREALSAQVERPDVADASDAAGRLARTRQLARERETLAALDERVAAHGELAQLYAQWRALAQQQARFASHRILQSVALLAAVFLALVVVSRLVSRALQRLRLDRRQAEALRTVVVVALQVLGVLFAVFVLIGPPTQLSTFLGLAGAGLTVALKDFIVAFAGWFVLMGRNGIRLGDWVEIRGVAGEVVELGMFHTVLLETGNWADSGHPTGRRVTFTNGYAIEGHYFNFSTTGQWLWDELHVVVPNGADLNAFVGAISRKVGELTAANVRQAEEEWRRAAPTRKFTGLSAEPAIRVKPVVGGTEISLRYVARADQRYRLRSDLYGAAVDLLGGKPAAVPAPEPTPN